MQQEVEFVYDILRNRIKKQVDGDGNGTFETITKFSYDLNGNAFLDLDNGGSLITRRLYTNAVDAVFARIGSSNNEDWYLTDMLGSVRDIIDSSGTLQNHLDYSTWGAVTNESTPAYGDRYTWTGRERDLEIDLQYNRARYYDASIGKWISEDPIGFDAGDSNLTRYVTNGPINGIDPFGLQVLPPADAEITQERLDSLKKIKTKDEWLGQVAKKERTFKQSEILALLKYREAEHVLGAFEGLKKAPADYNSFGLLTRMAKQIRSRAFWTSGSSAGFVLFQLPPPMNVFHYAGTRPLVHSLIRNLDSPVYLTRERAGRILRSFAFIAIDELRAAAKNGTQEQKTRATKIIRDKIEPFFSEYEFLAIMKQDRKLLAGIPKEADIYPADIVALARGALKRLERAGGK